MISRKLASLIHDHSNDLYERWLRELRQHPDTRTYHQLDQDVLKQRVFNVYGQLSRWLASEGYREEIEQIFTKIGAERYREGFGLGEVIKAQVLTRRILIDFVRHHGLFDSAHELFQVLDLYDTVLMFFDRVHYYTIRGYEEEAHLRKHLAP